MGEARRKYQVITWKSVIVRNKGKSGDWFRRDIQSIGEKPKRRNWLESYPSVWVNNEWSEAPQCDHQELSGMMIPRRQKKRNRLWGAVSNFTAFHCLRSVPNTLQAARKFIKLYCPLVLEYCRVISTGFIWEVLRERHVSAIGILVVCRYAQEKSSALG